MSARTASPVGALSHPKICDREAAVRAKFQNEHETLPSNSGFHACALSIKILISGWVLQLV